MSASKPEPLYQRQAPRRCPVCGTSSYSSSGIHPQCSARRLDADRMERLKQSQPVEAAAAR